MKKKKKERRKEKGKSMQGGEGREEECGSEERTPSTTNKHCMSRMNERHQQNRNGRERTKERE
jgi:hypothetical protein